ncbi:MAG TPA: dTDP-4-dehydrorhamnose 3,5-epimerase family protein [Pyrinomonadaceae bacterium]|jgi:dTDP-4-dehydrorhamnose 3,5-epimerase
MRPKHESSAEGAATGAARVGSADGAGALTALTAADLARGTIEGVVVRDLRKHLDERGWLAEIYRDDDEATAGFRPAMAYASTTQPGVERGPHEHHDQADHFCFIGPSNFKLRLWDNRPGSPTYGRVMTVYAGEDAPRAVVVPKGVVHAYRNVGQSVGLVINLPDRLYAGPGRREEVDEIRHEDDPATIFRLED